jgi:hypothetical protein
MDTGRLKTAGWGWHENGDFQSVNVEDLVFWVVTHWAAGLVIPVVSM